MAKHIHVSVPEYIYKRISPHIGSNLSESVAGLLLDAVEFRNSKVIESSPKRSADDVECELWGLNPYSKDFFSEVDVFDHLNFSMSYMAYDSVGGIF